MLGIAPGVAPRIVVFVLLESWDALPRMEFRIPRMEDSCSENTPELSQSSENGLFAPRAFFPEIGVVPRILKNGIKVIELLLPTSFSTA